MNLPSSLISEFVKVTNDTTEVKTESTHYGTIVEHEDSKYVRIDGSDLLTPVITTTTYEDGQRVLVMIKDHTAVVTGNISSPSPTTKEVDDKIGNVITEVEILVADKVTTKDFDAQTGRIDTLVSDNVTIKESLTAQKATIDELEADNVTINETLTAQSATITELKTTKLSATDADLKYATIEELNATDANIHNLTADYGDFKQLTTDELSAHEASIGELEAKKLSAEEAELKYANIDFANIDMAAVEKIFAESGIIKDLITSNGTITGELVGVTIKGDLIEGGTVIADKLVVKGTDGLYYKLNTDGVSTEAEQTEYNSLNGSVITAKSITATKISVDDLVAFGATIGGFHITTNAIYSGVKESVDNTTQGIYMDKDGQLALGDSNSFLKYYQDTDGSYKLEITAATIRLGTSNKTVEEAIDEATDEVQSDLDETISIVNDAVLDIDSVKAIISNLVIGPDGGSLMTQTADGGGWYFDISSILENIDSVTNDVDDLNGDLKSASDTIDILKQNVEDLGEYTEYIKFTTINDQPAIILGEADSSFKVQITNTMIEFLEGTTTPAYISNQSLYITKAVISEELQQGGFIWKVESNGSLSLLWKGV